MVSQNVLSMPVHERKEVFHLLRMLKIRRGITHLAVTLGKNAASQSLRAVSQVNQQQDRARQIVEFRRQCLANIKDFGKGRDNEGERRCHALFSIRFLPAGLH